MTGRTSWRLEGAPTGQCRAVCDAWVQLCSGPTALYGTSQARAGLVQEGHDVLAEDVALQVDEVPHALAG